jgi:hypothetical protein
MREINTLDKPQRHGQLRVRNPGETLRASEEEIRLQLWQEKPFPCDSMDVFTV